MARKQVTLADALEMEAATMIGVRCYTCTLLERMTADDLAVFKNVSANKSVSTPTIVRALKASGYEITAGSLARHRRGDCLNR
jgi:hypothetical protein